MLLHFITDVVERRTRFQSLDSLKKTFFRYADELAPFFRNLPDTERPATVAVKTVLISAQIDADDIALADHPIVRNAVHDRFVNRNASRCGIPAVTETGRLCAARLDEIIDERIDFLRRHAGFDAFADEFQTVAYDRVRLAQECKLFFGLNENVHYFNSSSLALISSNSTSAGASEPVKLRIKPFFV